MPPAFLHLAMLIVAQGAQFVGLQESPRGVLVMFSDPLTGTTLALLATEITAETLSRRLRESRDGIKASAPSSA